MKQQAGGAPGSGSQSAFCAESCCALRRTWPGGALKVSRSICSDRVAVAFTLTGTHTGGLMGIDATGNRVKVNGTVFGRFEAGQIVEQWEVLGQFSLFAQLGVLSLLM